MPSFKTSIKDLRRIGLFMARPQIVFIVLPWLMVLLIAGTLSQRWISVYEAQTIFFSSFILWLGPIPLPGGAAAISVLAAGLTAKLLIASPWNLDKSGIILTHTGIFLLLIGSLLTAITNSEGNIILAEGQSTNIVADYDDRIPEGKSKTYATLPFTIELTDFRKTDHPGTDMAKSYESDIIVHDGNISWPVRIRMNEPLRYKGYTFYQSSFGQNPDGAEVTVLDVVRNTGRTFPYVSGFVIFTGLLLHTGIRIRKSGKRAKED